MAYKAIVTFTDLQDNNHRYLAGDIFPREGLTVSDERLAELSSDKNRRHKPVIEEVLEEKLEEIPDKVVETEPEKSEKSAPKKGGRKKTDVK